MLKSIAMSFSGSLNFFKNYFVFVLWLISQFFFAPFACLLYEMNLVSKYQFPIKIILLSYYWDLIEFIVSFWGNWYLYSVEYSQIMLGYFSLFRYSFNVFQLSFIFNRNIIHIKLTILKHITQWFLVYSLCCTIITTF